MDKIRINLYDLLISLSKAGDLVTPRLSNHHRQVAYLSYKLAEQLGLPTRDQIEVLLAALVHDIGALPKDEKLELLSVEPENINVHSFRGAHLLKEFAPLQDIANIIRYHHIPWDYGKGNMHDGNPVPLASHIIHLADRVSIMSGTYQIMGLHVNHVTRDIAQEKGSIFKPVLIDSLIELSKIDYIWLDLKSQEPLNGLSDITRTFDILALEIDDVVALAHIFSHIIDFRSRFTACHSAGVANTAEKIAEYLAFSPYERKMMLIAGYLHDLGKLAIDNSILEKPDKLTENELSLIRSHAYYTYHMLKPIKQFKTINKWASYHHEKINGKGYPFHISGDNLTLGSRIMAVADVFTAITENRPYRKGLDDARSTQILNSMVTDGSLDKTVVSVLLDHYQEINEIRISAQELALEQYQNFTDSI